MNSSHFGSLFVSYSHTDKAHMQAFRIHLQVMTSERLQVWTDIDIPTGVEWGSFLESNLTQASSALIFASPDYLVSTWRRRELKELSSAHRKKRIRNALGVQLQPCGLRYS